jgi:hypothetical protein
MPPRDSRRGTRATNRRRSSGRSDAPRWRIALYVLILTSLVTVGAWLAFKSNEVAVETDPTSLCPTRKAPTEVLAILLDPSEQFSEPARLQIQNELMRVRSRLPRFGLVEVYTVDRVEQRLPEPIIHLCNPGSGADLNRLYQNPDLARKTWNAFSGRVGAQIDKEMSGPDRSASPIFEAIQAVALRTFGRPEYDGVPKRLVLVSDLLQHVPGRLSMYATVPSFDSFRTAPYFADIRANLDGVSVEVLYLTRPTVATQGREHVRFWEEYFRSQGAVVESVEKIFGDK